MSRQAISSTLGHPIMSVLSSLINCASWSLILSALHFYLPLHFAHGLLPRNVFFDLLNFASFVLWVVLKGAESSLLAGSTASAVDVLS